MRQIKFSHSDYEKFRRKNRFPPFKARLLQVFTMNSTDISDAFRDYDTRYYEKGELCFFPLRGRAFLVLLLEEEETQQIFTTVRSLNQEKLRYYRSLQGETFEIVYTGE